MEKKLSQLEEIIAPLGPIVVKKIKNIDNAVLFEYVRLEQYQEIKRRFEASTLNPHFDLWLWARNLVATLTGGRSSSGTGVDPIFFPPDDSVGAALIDDILLNDSELAQEQSTLIEGALEEINQYSSELKTSKGTTGGKLVITQQENDIVLKRRKVRGLIVQTGLVISQEDYDQLSALLGDVDDKKNEYIELYLLRYHDKSFYPPTLGSNALAYYQELEKIGVTAQLFATPQQHYFTEYGSEHYDIDQYFGSFGSIMNNATAVDRVRAGGSFEVNLVHYGPFHNLVVTKLNEILREAKKKIILFIIYDITINNNVYDGLETVAWSAGFAYNTNSRQEKMATRQLMILKSGKTPKTQPSAAQINAVFVALSSKAANAAAPTAGGVEPSAEKITFPILSPYEKAVIIAERAVHLSKNCPPKTKVPAGITDPLLIAEMELEQKVMPMMLPRMGEMWDVNELEDFDSGAYRY